MDFQLSTLKSQLSVTSWLFIISFWHMTSSELWLAWGMCVKKQALFTHWETDHHWRIEITEGRRGSRTTFSLTHHTGHRLLGYGPFCFQYNNRNNTATDWHLREMWLVLDNGSFSHKIFLIPEITSTWSGMCKNLAPMREPSLGAVLRHFCSVYQL